MMPSGNVELVIRGGTVVSEGKIRRSDVAIAGGQIVTVAPGLAAAPEEIDATGMLVLPGGVDTHCHIEQISGAGLMNADTWESATRSAAHGGTTTVVSFAAQHPRHRMRDVVADYAALAAKGAVIDYAFHMIVSDVTGENLANDIPRLIDAGHRSIKIFTTYDKVRLDDHAILDVLAVAKARGALVCFHAENDGLIRHMTARLLADGRTGPHHHAESHPREAEIEAIARMCRFAEFVGTPIMIFHVSTQEGAEIVRVARARGAPVQAETCPHYLFMDESILRREDPSRFLCSPPQRLADDQDALWDAIADGTIELITSDHAPYRMDGTGKFANGRGAPFNRIANGMPGLETRLPLMFDAMVTKGRLGIEKFVELVATAPACAFGLTRKGDIREGYDADIAIWDPDYKITYGTDDLHDDVGYNPFVGVNVKGHPMTVLSRGRVVLRDKTFVAEEPDGELVQMDR